MQLNVYTASQKGRNSRQSLHQDRVPSAITPCQLQFFTDDGGGGGSSSSSSCMGLPIGQLMLLEQASGAATVHGESASVASLVNSLSAARPASQQQQAQSGYGTLSLKVDVSATLRRDEFAGIKHNQPQGLNPDTAVLRQYAPAALQVGLLMVVSMQEWASHGHSC